jgi:hypothetical protein
MSWGDLAAVAEAIASVAVVVSLVYLAIQVRLQAKENQMAQINSLTQQWGEAVQALATHEDLYDIWLRGLANFDGLTAEERGRFSAMLVNLTQIFESLHLHRKEAGVDAGLWEAFDIRLRDVFATPGVQSWWALRRHWHTPRFQEHVDRAIARSHEHEGRYAAIYGKGGDSAASHSTATNGSTATSAAGMSAPARSA